MVELLVLELELLVDVAHNQSIFLMVIFQGDISHPSIQRFNSFTPTDTYAISV